MQTVIGPELGLGVPVAASGWDDLDLEAMYKLNHCHSSCIGRDIALLSTGNLPCFLLGVLLHKNSRASAAKCLLFGQHD
jgi:hypothetical protein